MKKSIFIIAIVFIASVQSWAQSVTINEASGWLESAFVKWQPVSNAESYNVYYSNDGTTYTKIDNQLIRSYGTYYCADAMGLAAGNYTLKVAPVIAGIEETASITENLTVLAQDRTGFAFEGGRVPGAYKADGTPKDGAVILYITQNTKNTISMTITGATANPCVGLQNILYAIKKGSDTRPFIIRLIGNITDMDVMEGEDIVIENKNNASSYLTFEGIGSDAVCNGWGVRLKSATNIEVRNLGSMNCNSTAGDDFGLQQDNDHIWLHNCDMFYGDAGSDADQIKGDGALDNKGSTYVTFSYNHFWDSGKASLLGLSEDTTNGLYITYHHNWFDHSDSRHPRVRFYSAHVYNNYYDGNAKYGVGSTMGSSVFVENNVFRNCKYPMLTSMQGSDIFSDGSGTFSSEDGGTIKAYNNPMTGQSRYIPYNATSYPVEFDAVETTSRGEVISSSITSKKGANTYNNFDTDAALYVKTFVPEEPEVAKTKLMTYAGRINGGDLKWVFNNSEDDASYAVIPELKAALTNYTSTLVAVQGENTGNIGSQTLTCTSNNKDQTVSTDNAISSIIFTWGGDATDATVTGLPASGISFVKSTTAKTITISGTPTATTTYSISTTGSTGTPTTLSGTITLAGSVTGDMVHNFTLAGKTSSFYTITGNLSDSKGTVSYAGLTLTQCLKIESSTLITFTTSQSSSLTLVFNVDFIGKIYVNDVAYNPTAGVLTIPLAAGSNTIKKGDSSNLFYMSVVYSTSGIQNTNASVVKFYPNPVKDYLSILSDVKVEKIEIYNLSGVLVKSVEGNVNSIDMSKMNKGSYLVKTVTGNGVVKQMILKN
ncbi:MAG: T9SS type A sorting domain-containing protein [Paludibacter sp.]|nr:T9SS type A sorting domain-containing protein [Paludibacter sp.]